MAGGASTRYKLGDLVFAKMRGFPHWPARVCSNDVTKKMIGVFFFGTHQIGLVLRDKVVPYAGNQAKYGKGVRIRGFTEGMWEIQNTPGVESKQKSPTKTSSPKAPTGKDPAPQKSPNRGGRRPKQSPAEPASGSASVDTTAETTKPMSAEPASSSIPGAGKKVVATPKSKTTKAPAPRETTSPTATSVTEDVIQPKVRRTRSLKNASSPQTEHKAIKVLPAKPSGISVALTEATTAETSIPSPAKFPLNSPPLTNATTAETSQLSSAKATRSTTPVTKATKASISNPSQAKATRSSAPLTDATTANISQPSLAKNTRSSSPLTEAISSKSSPSKVTRSSAQLTNASVDDNTTKATPAKPATISIHLPNVSNAKCQSSPAKVTRSSAPLIDASTTNAGQPSLAKLQEALLRQLMLPQPMLSNQA
ncbi:unnamed protein product [Gadus morhua 'NCC']